MNEIVFVIVLVSVNFTKRSMFFVQVFSKGRLREVFKKICESSLILMDQKKDAWGYSK